MLFNLRAFPDIIKSALYSTTDGSFYETFYPANLTPQSFIQTICEEQEDL